MTVDPARLSRLERTILDTLYRLGEASAADVAAAMGTDTSEDSVRVTVGKMSRKGVLTHRPDGTRHLYRPAVPRDAAAESAWKHLTRTYFQGASASAVLAMLNLSAGALSEGELEKIADWVDAELGEDTPGGAATDAQGLPRSGGGRP